LVPRGGRCLADATSDPNDPSGYSKTDLISQGFIHTPELMALVSDTRGVDTIDIARFDAIVVAGGQAPMFNFEKAAALHAKFVDWRSFAVRDGNLVTGQPNFSGAETARLVIEALGR
jgi:putative intracellular protease/amidase